MPCKRTIAPLLIVVFATGVSDSFALTVTRANGGACGASRYVYDQPPGKSPSSQAGVLFITDVCDDQRIVLGIDNEERELTRPRGRPLGDGVPYKDGTFTVRVRQGKLVHKALLAKPPDAACSDPRHKEYMLVYHASVTIEAPAGSKAIQGTLVVSSTCGA